LIEIEITTQVFCRPTLPRQLDLYVSKVFMARLKINTAKVYAHALAGDNLAFFQSIHHLNLAKLQRS